MYEFYKNSQGETIEGYLGATDKFNGIVFLLKEPNNPGGADEFWFKNMLVSKEKYLSESAGSRNIFSKFKNRFSEMLGYLDEKAELENSIFCNVNPIYGDREATRSFYQELKNGKAELMLEYFSELKDNITVFTCKEIYRHLLKSGMLNIKKEYAGLRYKNATLGCFECEIKHTKVTVYEIYHPSRSSKIQKE